MSGPASSPSDPGETRQEGSAPTKAQPLSVHGDDGTNEGQDGVQIGPQYYSGRPRIVTYGADEHALRLLLEMPDGMTALSAYALPGEQPMPHEYQLVGCAFVGRTANGYEHLRHVMLCLSQGERDYTQHFQLSAPQPKLRHGELLGGPTRTDCEGAS